MGEYFSTDFKLELENSIKVHFEEKNDFFLYFSEFSVSHPLKMWLSWQKEKVYPSNFGFKTLLI